MDRIIRDRIICSIDKMQDDIIAIGQNIWETPETGFREVRTNRLVADQFRNLGLEFISCGDIPGLKATFDTGKPGPGLAILGELDAVVCYDHPDCDKETGAVHACGHNIQITSMLGAAAGLLDSGVLDQLTGKIHFIAVPAEEFIEVEYRMMLREKGLIRYLGGKPELLHRGFFDDVDLCMMIHAYDCEGKKARVTTSSNGCLVKKIRYIGKAAHAGANPQHGINALYAASIGMMAINSIRETFTESDYIRVHPIITKGGEIVNVIPADVRMETFVRGKTMENILDANIKVNRALVGGAVAMGAKVEIEDIPGYFPLKSDTAMMDLTREVLTELAGSGMILECGHGTGSTDLGDLSTLMPVIHPYFGGVTGGVHSAQFTITDEDTAYIFSSKFLACMAADLLMDNAKKANGIVDTYRPLFASKEEYFNYADSLFTKKIYPETDLL